MLPVSHASSLSSTYWESVRSSDRAGSVTDWTVGTVPA